MRSRTAEHFLSPENDTVEPMRWLWFLPRWSLAVVLVTLVFSVMLFGGVGQQPSDSALGAEYAELLQAARSPGMFRVAWTLDAVIWLMLGGSLLALAGIQSCHAPITAKIGAACGIGQLIGALGGFIRVNGISELAARYVTATPLEQTALHESYCNLWLVINSHFHIALLLQGVGFVLVTWSLFRLQGFPRWLAAWLALPGLLAVTQFVLFAAGEPFLRALNIVGLILGNIMLNSALVIALWRPSTPLVSAVAGDPAMR